MDINLQAVTWLGVFVVMLIVEAITLGLTTIWFAGGALAAFGLAIAGVDTLLQIVAFCVVSVVLLIATRPAAVRWLNRERVRTNAESLVGVTAVVTEPINNLAGKGRVQVKGQSWSARAVADDIQIEAEKQVRITKISGVKLIVEEV